MKTRLPSVRRAQAADHDTLLQLWERSVRATHHFLSGAEIAELRPLVAQELADPAAEWWVAELEGGSVAGFLGYTHGSIEGLFVDPAFRGRGIGSMLVAYAQRLTGGALRVDVNEQNPEACGFYQSLGFSVCGRSPVDAGGRPFPIVHMIRPLQLAGPA